jgi:hypothetical protein
MERELPGMSLSLRFGYCRVNQLKADIGHNRSSKFFGRGSVRVRYENADSLQKQRHMTRNAIRWRILDLGETALSSKWVTATWRATANDVGVKIEADRNYYSFLRRRHKVFERYRFCRYKLPKN